MHVLRPRNNKSGEPELNNIGYKLQDMNNSIICDSLSDARLNRILGMIEEIDPLIMVKLDDGTWIRF